MLAVDVNRGGAEACERVGGGLGERAEDAVIERAFESERKLFKVEGEDVIGFPNEFFGDFVGLFEDVGSFTLFLRLNLIFYHIIYDSHFLKFLT